MSVKQIAQLPGARPAPLPTALAPMLPTLTDAPFSHPDWLFEPKLDGMRAIALIEHGGVRLLSRLGNDAAPRYPALASELAGQTDRAVALDGEIVALDSDGLPSFHLLQQRINVGSRSGVLWADIEIPLTYYVFDVLHLDGYDLRATPLDVRKDLLRELIITTPRIRIVEHFDTVGELAFEAAIEHGYEGVVAKRTNSTYDAGKRTKKWLKVKGTGTAEFVVGGYSAGKGSRASTFGGLILGHFDDGALHYAAHVGSGFDARLLQKLRAQLDTIRANESPFADQVTRSRYAFGGPHGKPTWVHPRIVVEVQFANWTPDGRLRAPVFRGVREDKTPTDAVRPRIARPTSGQRRLL